MQDEQQQSGPQEYKYWGFISYSHADEKWADWLHKSLETYAVPKQLVGKPTKYGPIPKRAFPIFRDRDELPSSANLGDKLTAALTGSRYLIVICSPRAVGSQWVNEEIKTFKSLGRESQVLCLIVDGEPYASLNPQLGLEECFPEPVRYQIDENRQITDIRTEPIAADARKGKDGKPNARLKLLSGMFNVNFSDLKQRDHERAQRRLKQILVGVMVLFVVFLALGINLFYQKKKADQATIRAEDNATAATRALASAVEQKALAQKNEKEAISQADRARKAEAEAVKQTTIAQENEKVAVEQTALALTNLKEATRQRALAEANEKEANIQKEEAVKQKDLAQKNFLAAEAARKVADEQRRRAVSALSISDYNEGARLAEEGRISSAMAYMARSLGWDPENSSAEARLISLLSEKNWSLPRTAPLKHSGPVVDVDYHPSGKYVLTASGSAAQIWDVDTGKPAGEAVSHRNSVQAVRFSPDGKQFVTASDPEAQIWDVETREKTGTALAHKGRVYAARFSSDGAKVATSSADRSAKIWDARTGKEIATINVAGLPADIAFSKDGRYLVVAFDTFAQVFDTATGSPFGAQMKHDGGVFGIAFDPTGRFVATASGDSTARVWDALSGAPASGPLKHDGRVISAAFSPTGIHLVTTSEDDTARVWVVATGEALGSPMRHDLDVTRAVVSPNGRWLATSSEDRTARIWNLMTGKPVAEPIKFEGPIKAARFSRDGRSLIVGSEDSTAQVWTCLSGQPKSEPLTHGNFPLYWSAFSPNSKRLVTCGHDRVARIWDIGTGKQLTEPLSVSGRPSYAEFDPTGDRLIVCTDDGNVQVFDSKTGEPVGPRHIAQGSKFIHAEYSPDGSSLLIVGSRAASVLDAATGKPRFEKPVEHDRRLAINAGRFNVDGTLFITAGSDKAARVWDAKTGEAKGGPYMHTDDVTDAVISADGKFVATGSRDRTARYWELATAKPLTEPMAHDRAINSVDLSPNGVYLIAACDDATVRVWRTSTGQAAAEPLLHKDRVQSARFSADGRLVVSYGNEDTARVWETANWKLVTAPLVHSGTVNSAVFSKDGAFVTTSSRDETARIWQISLPGNAPAWLTQLAETVGGFRMVAAESGGGTELVLNPWEKLTSVKAEIDKGAEDTYAKWGNWFLADRFSRTVSSFSTFKLTDYVDRKVENAEPDSLVEALDLQPDHALALARLGLVSTNSTLASFYTDLAVQYSPDDHRTLWLRGEVLQRLDNYADAWPFLERAAKLDPRVVDAFGPEGAEFESANLSGTVSKGWLPAGWVDNNADKKYDLVYTKLSDGPPGTGAAIRINAKGPAGRAELAGVRFIARAKANRFIEFWARGKRGDSTTVSARGFSRANRERPPTYASEILRITDDDKWKQFRVPVRPVTDIAAEVVLQVQTSAVGLEIDISDIVVRLQ